jgi:hypothetical protein
MTPTQFLSQTQLNLLHTNSENPADPIPVEQDLCCVLDQPLPYYTKKAKIHDHINTQ